MAKTTLELADGLMLSAKKRALELGRPLRSIVETALLNYLADENNIKKKSGTHKKLDWKTVSGGLPEGLDISSRENMYLWLYRSKK